MKMLMILVLAAVVLAEPPPQQYLPPDSSYQTTHQDHFSPPAFNSPSSIYGTPSNTYGAPDALSSQTFNPNTHTQAIARPPSSTYGAPSSANGARRNNGLGGRKHGGGAKQPSAIYGPPAGAPSAIYGPPAGAPSSIYGPPSNVYGAPNGNAGYDDQSEPAKYEFAWEVKDQQSGNDFEHEEARDGDSAWGKYEVLLPDGRRQIVEYQANQDGYKPMIRYEGVANAGGYPSRGGPY